MSCLIGSIPSHLLTNKVDQEGRRVEEMGVLEMLAIDPMSSCTHKKSVLDEALGIGKS